MTEISGPFDGVTLGDATLAPYSRLEWSRIWRDILRSSKPDSGPLLGSGTSPDPGLTVTQTTPASASVNVSAGSALVRGTWYASDATVNLAIAANGSGNPRIDTVVLQKNPTTQTVRLAIVQGTPAGSPVPLALNQVDGSLWEIPVADIAVANGFATITNANITPRRNWAGIADGVYLIDILNNSGGALETGDVVIWDSGTDRAVTTTTTLGDSRIAGVWVGRTGAGGYGRVLRCGIGYVKVNGAVGRNQLLETYSTAKQAVYASFYTMNAFALTLEALGGTGLCLALVDVRIPREKAFASTVVGGAGNNNTANWADVHANAKVSFIPRSSRVKVTAQFIGAMANGADTGYWDIYSSSLAARAGDATTGLIGYVDTNSTGNHIPITVVAIFSGLTPGITQEFKLQQKTGAGASQVSTFAPLIMCAEEF